MRRDAVHVNELLPGIARDHQRGHQEQANAPLASMRFQEGRDGVLLR